jgi:hypothetical protein
LLVTFVLTCGPIEMPDTRGTELACRFRQCGGSALGLDGSWWGSAKTVQTVRVRPLPVASDRFARVALEVQLDQNSDQGARRRSEQRHLFKWMLGEGMPIGPSSRVLHPMCGPGISAAILAECGVKSYLGIDRSAVAVRHARRQFADVRGFRFLRATVPGYLQDHRGRRMHVALLTYEALNALPRRDSLRLLQALGQWTPHGWLGGDVRPPSAADGRSGHAVTAAPAGGALYTAPHFLLDLWGSSPDHRWWGHLLAVVPYARSRVAVVYRSILRLIELGELREELDCSGFQLCAFGTPFAGRDTDVPETSGNVAFIARATRNAK